MDIRDLLAESKRLARAAGTAAGGTSLSSSVIIDGEAGSYFSFSTSDRTDFVKDREASSWDVRVDRAARTGHMIREAGRYWVRSPEFSGSGWFVGPGIATQFPFDRLIVVDAVVVPGNGDEFNAAVLAPVACFPDLRQWSQLAYLPDHLSGTMTLRTDGEGRFQRLELSIIVREPAIDLEQLFELVGESIRNPDTQRRLASGDLTRGQLRRQLAESCHKGDLIYAFGLSTWVDEYGVVVDFEAPPENECVSVADALALMTDVGDLDPSLGIGN